MNAPKKMIYFGKPGTLTLTTLLQCVAVNLNLLSRYFSCLLPLLPTLDIPHRPQQLSTKGLTVSLAAWPGVEWTQEAL